ncbi:interferon-inducible GTPase 5-like [Cheilinus undulatus]|uniref:interferon-inducible GTPase 5-like n=1 Tax=Cheilinus undulatus TaxID=241271 RepID=UPI001BD432E4|nr:interferon-inducible GTPase 5-like [Cheilinus undulatus]
MGDPFDTEEIHKSIKEALIKNDRNLAVAKINEYFDRQKNIPLDIAITGESGAGKSTFVNAFRGIDNRDERAAPTGATETTMEITPYPHPKYPNVKFWDLPGIGTTKFPADQYIKYVGFERFDFFIIVSCDRFRENDVRLAKEIQRMEKKFYFVRSKIDNNVRDEERTQRDFNLERTLKKIRDNSIQSLQYHGFKSPQVFLVSSFDLTLYDFPLLEQTLERELPEHKRDAFLSAMPNISQEVIAKKKKSFKKRINFLASLSGVVASLLIPGLSMGVEVGMLVGEVKHYANQFGLDVDSLLSLASCTNIPFQELKDVTSSPLSATEITTELVMKEFSQCPRLLSLKVAEEGIRFIPGFGIPTAMTLSFITTQKALNIFLDALSDDAYKVFRRALGHKLK